MIATNNPIMMTKMIIARINLKKFSSSFLAWSGKGVGVPIGDGGW